MLTLLHFGQDMQAAEILRDAVVLALARTHNLPALRSADGGSPRGSGDPSGKERTGKAGKSPDAGSRVRTLDLSPMERTHKFNPANTADAGPQVRTQDVSASGLTHNSSATKFGDIGSPGRYKDVPNAIASKMARQLSDYVVTRLEQARRDVMQQGFWKPQHAVGLLLYAKGFQGSISILSGSSDWTVLQYPDFIDRH
jgi:hypothetical protein